jgi:hypothetical protein
MRHDSYAMSAFTNLLTYKLFIEWVFMQLNINSLSWLQLIHDSVRIMDSFHQLHFSSLCR